MENRLFGNRFDIRSSTHRLKREGYFIHTFRSFQGNLGKKRLYFGFASAGILSLQKPQEGLFLIKNRKRPSVIFTFFTFKSHGSAAANPTPAKVNTIRTAGVPVATGFPGKGFPAEPASFQSLDGLLDGFRHRVYLCLFRAVFIPDGLDRRLPPEKSLYFFHSSRLPPSDGDILRCNR